MGSLWNFVPKNQLRLFRRTQSFPPEKSAQDSMESLWKFCSKKSTAAFSPHAKFSARRECPRFHGEHVEIQPDSRTTCTFNGADASAFYR
jgi:hypothetical protein